MTLENLKKIYRGNQSDAVIDWSLYLCIRRVFADINLQSIFGSRGCHGKHIFPDDSG